MKNNVSCNINNNNSRTNYLIIIVTLLILTLKPSNTQTVAFDNTRVHKLTDQD